MNSRVQELFDTIAAARTELEALRKVCAHPSYEVGLWGWDRPGSISNARICTECRTNIGPPTVGETLAMNNRTTVTTSKQGSD